MKPKWSTGLLLCKKHKQDPSSWLMSSVFPIWRGKEISETYQTKCLHKKPDSIKYVQLVYRESILILHIK